MVDGVQKEYNMSKYTEVIYPKDEKNQYPFKLSKYIYDRFMKGYQSSDVPKMLDIGCCTGTALKNFGQCSNHELELHGIDIRDEEVEGIKFKTCNIEKDRIPYPDNYFDFVYSKSVLEHVKNTDKFLAESFRVLKPGGVFIGLTPDWLSQYKYFWDDYTHVKPFTRKGLRDALRIHEMVDVDCEFFYQLPFLWRYPKLTFIVKLIAAVVPDSWKWKDSEQRNTKDRKLIRFSKEKMLLSYGKKAKAC
jgi:ubiquinone/menaquinone biosynthesis C-methylase UbiE